MQCPNCGAVANEQDAFCGECGEPLAQVAPAAEPIRPPQRQAQPARGPILVPRSPAAARPAPRRKQGSRLTVLMVLLGAGVAALGCLFVAGVLVWRAFPWEPTPEPTLEPTPQPTLPPTPRPVLYEETFGDPASGWDVYSDDDSWAGYLEGEYGLAVFKADYMAWGNPGLEEPPANFEVEVDARQVKGPLDNNFGLLVRYQAGGDSFYWFEISGDGYYSVDLMVQNEWTTLVDWETSDVINQGLGATNHLKVVCSGDHYSFYVNGIYLAGVSDDSLSDGNIGLAIGAFDEPGVEVHFDNLRLYPLQE